MTVQICLSPKYFEKMQNNCLKNKLVSDPRLSFDTKFSNKRACRSNLKIERAGFLLGTYFKTYSDKIICLDIGITKIFLSKNSRNINFVKLSLSKGIFAQRIANQNAAHNYFHVHSFWKYIVSVFRLKVLVKGRILNRARGGFSLGIFGLVAFYPVSQYIRLIRKKKKRVKRWDKSFFINVSWMKNYRSKKRCLVGYNVTGSISNMSRERKNIVFISFKKKSDCRSISLERRLLVFKSLPRKTDNIKCLN